MLSKPFDTKRKCQRLRGGTDVSSLPITQSGEGCVSSEILSVSGEICLRWQESRTKEKALRFKPEGFLKRRHQ